MSKEAYIRACEYGMSQGMSPSMAAATATERISQGSTGLHPLNPNRDECGRMTPAHGVEGLQVPCIAPHGHTGRCVPLPITPRRGEIDPDRRRALWGEAYKLALEECGHLTFTQARSSIQALLRVAREHGIDPREFEGVRE